MNQYEHHFTCPRCAEEISFLLEPRDDEQCYVEDCEVCCNPIEVRFAFNGEDLQAFAAKLAN